jgi:drug/metabolite transporter (DMT)-like permease
MPATAFPPSPAASPPIAASAARRGLWLGLLGVAIFALTMPMTRLAVGTPDAPRLDAVFVALGRAVVAGLLSAAFLAATRAPWPPRRDWVLLAVTAAGVVFGFPMATSFALRHVEAVHAAVVVGALPLATAAVGALLHRQRPSAGFWLCSLAGGALVVGFTLWRGAAAGGSGLHAADGLLVLAVAAAAVGYGTGALLAQRMRAEHVICWALLLSLPLTLPAAWVSRPQAAVPAAAWLGFAYTALFSMWLGFFAWYRGLALGGTVRVSQVQLLQPFLSMLFAVPLLGERLEAATLAFAAAVVATVFIGRRMPVGARA